LAKGTVITKEDFDKYVMGTLAPYFTLDETGTVRPSGSSSKEPTPKTAIGRSAEELSAMFHAELKAAVDKVVELEKQRTAESKKVYDEWISEKQRVRDALIEKRVSISIIIIYIVSYILL
jgi:hypothetical protein